ncbi:MAG: energy-coupling factor ABC transporter permease [Christensenellaceae bacterium]|nr:energy-coupling factor ABC transporter permease [Christensenellaceae bacterium]
MHMADALLSAAVGGTMCAASAAAIGYSVTRIQKDELSEKKVPIMAVAGAFVFAAQMINFTIPGTGSSGHIGGGILLAALLGGYPALLTISAVLLIQCLFFADGGLLALGCNIFNMGVIPCLVVYPLLFKPMLRRKTSLAAIGAASVLATVLGLQFGAFAVVLETQASGITELPFSAFALLMQPIHLAIGLVEGLITAAVLGFVHSMRPEIMQSAIEGSAIGGGVPLRRVLLSFGAAALIVGALLSLFASAYPDGLEWSMERLAGTTELELKGGVLEGAAGIQGATAFMPDYDFKSPEEEGSPLGTSTAGVVGGALTFALAGGTALLISAVKKKNRGAKATA